MRGASRGEHRAWEGIVDRHLPLVNAIAHSYRLSAPDREDAVQTVWLTLNQHLPRLRHPERLRFWLRRVTKDVCSRQRRHGVRQHPVDPHDLVHFSLSDSPDPEAAYLDRERDEELYRAIRRLPDPRDRQAALRYLEDAHGCPHPDGVPDPREAANQRRRLRRRLRHMLKDPQ